MKTIPWLLAAVVGASAFGCASPHADVPAPTRFANEDQLKLQAARHWQLIADHFAEQMAANLQGKLNGRAIYIPQPGGEQAFVDGFRELLMTSLVARGVPVALVEQGSLVADVRYNAYRFKQDRAANTYYYGEATMLAAGLWAVGGVMAANITSANGVAVGAKVLTAAAAVDGFAWLKNEGLGAGRMASGNIPRSEIILTVTVVDAGRIASRQSNIYYTSDEDADLYWKRSNSAGGRAISVVGDCDSGGTKCAR